MTIPFNWGWWHHPRPLPIAPDPGWFTKPAPSFTEVEGVEWCEVHHDSDDGSFAGACHTASRLWDEGHDPEPCRFVPLYIKEES